MIWLSIICLLIAFLCYSAYVNAKKTIKVNKTEGTYTSIKMIGKLGMRKHFFVEYIIEYSVNNTVYKYRTETMFPSIILALAKEKLDKKLKNTKVDIYYDVNNPSKGSLKNNFVGKDEYYYLISTVLMVVLAIITIFI
jgi:hypothetical protein